MKKNFMPSITTAHNLIISLKYLTNVTFLAF